MLPLPYFLRYEWVSTVNHSLDIKLDVDFGGILINCS